ncbi:MAG: tRNA (adenosine(37)-N6)-threonylcarbamoyltransferase complex dimerization subunit type 1 TsaB [Rhodocyclaceae bacterium]|nr:tRNA (adenosine(37)-N6)-threonylcarbamoyltransferase complex dimerization subunit type 1 TsaB [Rhodocyclaceae bacterium]
MRVLALETATTDCSVALRVGEDVFAAAATPGADKPSEQVPGLVRRLLAEAGTRLHRLDAIAFDAGPGAFTGIRIGCGLAQGMALGANLPLVGLCSLRVLAMQAPPGVVLSTLDARMAEIYWGVYRRVGEGADADAQALGDARVEPPAGWVCPAGLDAAIGDGLAVCLPVLDGGSPGAESARLDSLAQERQQQGRGPSAAVRRLLDRLPATVRVVSAQARPRAIDMLPLAMADLRAGLATAPEHASPLYVRDKVALTAAEQLARKAAR